MLQSQKKMLKKATKDRKKASKKASKRAKKKIAKAKVLTKKAAKKAKKAEKAKMKVKLTKKCKCSGHSDEKKHGSSCKNWGWRLPWCYVGKQCNDAGVQVKNGHKWVPGCNSE